MKTSMIVLIAALSANAAEAQNRNKRKASGCFESHQAVGPKRLTEDRARGAAIQSWQREIIGQHGAEYSTYANAIQKQVSCYRAAVEDWSLTCRVVARPCKSS